MKFILIRFHIYGILCNIHLFLSIKECLMNLSKIDEVIKASPAIQIQSRISLLQRRAWNVLLANAYNELPDKDIHRVSLTELAAKLGFGDGNQEYLKEMLRALVDCTVEWNVSRQRQ